MQWIEKHFVPENTTPIRLRNYAQSIFSAVYPSNKGIKKAIKNGLILVNGTPGTTASMIVPGDIILLLEPLQKKIQPYPLSLEIVYENEHFAVINKPAGISVHNHYKRNIVNALAYNLKLSKFPDSLTNPLPVHRLDSQTSGLLLIAKTRSFQIEAGKMFEQAMIIKRYSAILVGRSPAEGIFDKAIDEKKSISRFKLIDVRSHNNFGWLSLVHLYPETGRTHQLRIHCANAGLPVLGERIYGLSIPNLKGQGLFLCASKLTFKNPFTGEEMQFELLPPKKFSRFFKIES